MRCDASSVKNVMHIEDQCNVPLADVITIFIVHRTVINIDDSNTASLTNQMTHRESGLYKQVVTTVVT